MGRVEEDVRERLGRRIRELRKAQSLSQESLATRANISQKYLSELERGAKAPALDTLVALSHDGLGVRLSTLFYGVDEARPKQLGKLEELLAGRPKAVQDKILQAVGLLVEASQVE